jgi:cell wall-associated NlpC family hydrolase
MIAQCIVAYAQVRSEARHASELVTQIILGEIVCILFVDGPWIRIKTEHGYEGFTRNEQFGVMGSGKYFPVDLLRLNSTSKSKTLSGLPFLCLEGSFIWPGADAMPIQFKANQTRSIANPMPFNPGLLAKQARNYLNIPYVWGGKTSIGLDCSGLVQSLFQNQGYAFPRDAWQQAEIGSIVDFRKENPSFKKGDLLFFCHPGKKIHHVAVSLGGSDYIHASEWVMINSLNPESALFNQERADSFVVAKRISDSDLISLFDSFKKLWREDQNK